MASNYNVFEKNLLHRVSDVETRPGHILPPIKGFENVPLLSLERAVEPLINIVDEINQMVWTVKQNCSMTPADGLTVDESACIMLYSLEWPPERQNSLYFILNQTLRAVDRRKLTPWFCYLKLLLVSLSKLPSFTETVYRGIKGDLHLQYPKDKVFVWWSFSSCTRCIDVLNKEAFFGTIGTRTMFIIEGSTGKDIRHHSLYSEEDEILLLPARQFRVKACLQMGNGLHSIQIQEIQPQYPLLAPIQGSTSTISTPTQLPISSSQPHQLAATSIQQWSPPPSIVIQNPRTKALLEKFKYGHFDLSGKRVLDSEVQFIIEHGMTNPKCVSIDLSHNHITAAGVALLASAFEYAPNLRELNLMQNRIEDKGATAIAEMLGKTNLTHLMLDYTGIKNKGAMDIARHLNENQTLIHLRITGNFIDDLAALCLFNAAQQHRSLTKVSIKNASD